MDAFKKAEVRPLYKKMKRQKNQTIGPITSFLMFQKFMKDTCMIKFIIILIQCFQYINAFFVKVFSFNYDKKNENFAWH